MNPVSQLQQIAPNLWFWTALHEEWQVAFSSAAWVADEGLVLVDPIELSAAGLAEMEKLGKPIAILLTNQNHERHASWFRKHYRIPVHVHRDAVPGIEIPPDEFFCDGATVPGNLLVMHLPGASQSECAFFSKTDGGTLLSGDVVMNGKQGLTFLPDQYCENSKQNRESARKLLDIQFETLTVAHGDPIFPKARDQFAKLFSA